MQLRSTALLVLVMAFAAPTRAMPINVTGVELELPALPGMCFMDRTHPFDQNAWARVSTAGSGNGPEFVALFADCRELQEARRGRDTLHHFGQYTRLKSAGPQGTFNMSRAEFVKKASVSVAGTTWQQKLDQATKKLGDRGYEGSALSLGTLHADSDAVFLGSINRYAEAGDTIITLVTGATLVRQVGLTINLYAPGASKETVESLLQQQRANIQALLRANP